MNDNCNFSDYTLVLSGAARKTLKKIPKKDRLVILEKLDLLKDNKKLLDVKRFKKIKFLYRIRVGNYRIVYKPDHDKKIISVIVIGNRKDVYKLLNILSYFVSFL